MTRTNGQRYVYIESLVLNIARLGAGALYNCETIKIKISIYVWTL